MTHVVSVSRIVRESFEKERECPRPGCRERKSPRHYACKHHWFELPQAIRDKITRGMASDKILWLEAHQEARKFWAESGIG